MTTSATTSPIKSPSRVEQRPHSNESRELTELESMIAKAGELKDSLFCAETLGNDEDYSSARLPESKKMRLSTYHPVDSSNLPKPHFSSPALKPNYNDFKKPVALPTPTFGPIFSEEKLSSTAMAQTPPKRTPPPTPRKKTPVGKESPYERKYQEASRGHFSFGGRLYQIQHLGQGSFSTVYTVVKNPSRLVPTVDNSELVIKMYNGIRTGFHPRALSGYLESALANYKQVMALGLPVAKIYNAETASTDLAIVQKRIDANVNLRNPTEMTQVQRFFDLSIKSGVLMDLQPANLKVENGTVVLIDFVEEMEDHNIVTMVNLAIKAWIDLCKESGFSREQTEAFLRELSSGFEEANPYFNAKWLQDLLNG